MSNTYTIVEIGNAYVVICVEDDYPSRRGAQGITDYCYSLQHAIDVVYAYMNSATYLVRPPNIITAFEYPRLPDGIGAQPSPRVITTRYGTTRYKADQATIHLSDRAWEHLQSRTRELLYDGHGRNQGCTHFILGLLKANPTHDPHKIPTYWTDARPDYLKEFDHERAASKIPQFPLWFESPLATGGDEHDLRRTRTINAKHLPEIEHMLWPLAQYFMIVPARGRDQLSPRARAHAALEAIGRQFLKPLNSPPANPLPADPDRRKRRNEQIATRKVKVDLVF